MNTDNLCPGCMNLREPAELTGFCPDCGYNFNSQQEPHRLKPRTRLHEKYIVGKVLGEGGFGITYLGYDTTLEMKVAIKEYYPAGFATRDVGVSSTVTPLTGEKAQFYENGNGKFIKEARTLAKFSNLPGIVSVRDFFEENNTSYIIMEYLEGMTLKTFLKQSGGRMEPAQVAGLLEPVINALSQVHQQGIIHRDISPDNMMVLPNGSMKLLDFGAAREQSSGEKSVSVMLKPGYAPEEQYRTHGVQGPWTDVYGISGTIYRCLTGSAPIEAMERMRQDTLKSPMELGVAIEPWRSGALMKGLSLYAENRYQTMDEFYKAYYLNLAMPQAQAFASASNYHMPAMDGETPTMPLQNPEQYVQNMQMSPNQTGSVPVQENAGPAPSLIPPMNPNPMQMPFGEMQPGMQPGMQNGMQNGMQGNVGPQYIYGNESEKKKSKGLRGWMIALIAGGAALIAGVVVLIVVLSGNSGKGEGDGVSSFAQATVTPQLQVTDTPTPEPTDAPDQGSGLPGEIAVPAGYFTSDYSTTVRGHAIGEFYNDALFLMTRDGIDWSMAAGNDQYVNHRWYAQLNDGFEPKALAAFDDMLYISCGEKGLLRSDLVNGGTIPIIRSEAINSFAFSDDKLFYIAMENIYNAYGDLYVADPDGQNEQLVMQKIKTNYMRSGSSDFEYINGKMYFIAQNENYQYGIYRCDGDGSNVEEVFTPSNYEDLCGLFYNGGKLYMYNTYPNSICSYNLDSGEFETLIEAPIQTSQPISFAGNALIYPYLDSTDYLCYYRQIYEGIDKNLPTSISATNLFYDSVGGELLCIADFGDFYGIDYEDGNVLSENLMDGISYYDRADIGQGTSDVVLEANADYRAAYTADVDTVNGSYVLIKCNAWDSGRFVCTSNSGYYILEDTEKVRYFGVIGDTLYYTVTTSDDKYEFRKRKLSDGEDYEVILGGTQACLFCIYDSKIYYDNYDDNYRLYCYDPQTGTNTKICDKSVGYYYLLNEMIYFEDISSESICMVDINGNACTELFSLADLSVSSLKNLIVFNCEGSTFLAMTSSDCALIVSSLNLEA